MKITTLSTWVFALLASFTAFAQPTSCDRVCLKGFVDLYMTSLAAHDPSKLPVAANLKFTENGVPMKLGEGFWKSAGKLSVPFYALDPETGGAALQGVVEDGNGQPAMFLLRLEVAARKITEIETAVVLKGTSNIFAPERIKQSPVLFTQPVPVAQRHTREELIKLSDAYFIALNTEGTPEYQRAPFAPGMNRIENGVQTTNVSVNGNPARSADEQLDQAIFKGLAVTDTRFPVVDVENGVALGIVLFRGGRTRPDNSTVGFVAEFFKVTGGQLQEIQAVIQSRPTAVGTGWN